MPNKERLKFLNKKAIDIVNGIDIQKLTDGIDNVELAYVLSTVDNIVTIKSNLEFVNQNRTNDDNPKE